MEESVQDELFHAISPYEEKSNCKIILSSTPNRPDGLMQKIDKEPNSKYEKLKADYTFSLDTIYDRKDIEKKKLDTEIEGSHNYSAPTFYLYKPFVSTHFYQSTCYSNRKKSAAWSSQ